jgi:hypothetical protein
VLAESLIWPGEEDLAHGREPLKRVVATVVGPVTVGPFVVAGRVNQRIDEAVELGPHHREVLVGALRGPALDVTQVVNELDRWIRVDLINHLRKAGDLSVPIRNIANDGEREGLVVRSLVSSGWADAVVVNAPTATTDAMAMLSTIPRQRVMSCFLQVSVLPGASRADSLVTPPSDTRMCGTLISLAEQLLTSR